MPQAVAVPAITAGAGLLGGAMQSRAAGRAARYQRDSNREALEYQRERQRVEDQRYQQRWDAYQRDLGDWKAKYGFGSSPSGAPAATGGGGGGVEAAAVTLGDLTGSQPQAAAEPEKPQQGAAPETLGDWSDWRRYGIGA